MFVRQPFVVVTADKYLDVNTEIENLKNAVVKVCCCLIYDRWCPGLLIIFVLVAESGSACLLWL